MLLSLAGVDRHIWLAGEAAGRLVEPLVDDAAVHVVVLEDAEPARTAGDRVVLHVAVGQREGRRPGAVKRARRDVVVIDPGALRAGPVYESGTERHGGCVGACKGPVGVVGAHDAEDPRGRPQLRRELAAAVRGLVGVGQRLEQRVRARREDGAFRRRGERELIECRSAPWRLRAVAEGVRPRHHDRAGERGVATVGVRDRQATVDEAENRAAVGGLPLLLGLVVGGGGTVDVGDDHDGRSVDQDLDVVDMGSPIGGRERPRMRASLGACWNHAVLHDVRGCGRQVLVICPHDVGGASGVDGDL